MANSRVTYLSKRTNNAVEYKNDEAEINNKVGEEPAINKNRSLCIRDKDMIWGVDLFVGKSDLSTSILFGRELSFSPFYPILQCLKIALLLAHSTLQRYDLYLSCAIDYTLIDKRIANHNIKKHVRSCQVSIL